MRVEALPKSTGSTANSAQPAIEPAISRLQVRHATTEPRRPTEVASTILKQRIFSPHKSFTLWLYTPRGCKRVMIPAAFSAATLWSSRTKLLLRYCGIRPHWNIYSSDSTVDCKKELQSLDCTYTSDWKYLNAITISK